MIEINLLPAELKKRKRKIELPDISFLPIFAGLLGLIIVIHLLLYLSVALKTRTLTRLEKRWQEISPAKEEAEKYKLELTNMRARIEAIDGLIQGRLSWTKKLNDLSDAMIDGVWLNRLWLEKRVTLQRSGTEEKLRQSEIKTKSKPLKIISKTFHINGSVAVSGGEEPAIVGKFIRSLKGNKRFFSDFKEIETASIQRKRLKEAEVMDFELICYFK